MNTLQIEERDRAVAAMIQKFNTEFSEALIQCEEESDAGLASWLGTLGLALKEEVANSYKDFDSKMERAEEMRGKAETAQNTVPAVRQAYTDRILFISAKLGELRDYLASRHLITKSAP